jgi:hypothetical protein
VIRTLLAFLLAALPILSAGQTSTRIVKPEIRVGDSWTYRSTNLLEPGTIEHESRVSFVDDKVILLVSTRKGDGKEFDSSWTTEWNALADYSGRMFRPHSGLLRFPLRIGEKHDFANELVRPRVYTDLHTTTTGTVTVAGWDTVEVPAGKFRAIKVVVEGEGRTDFYRPYAVQTSIWYVPEVRRWVKYQASNPAGVRSEELLSYKLNED